MSGKDSRIYVGNLPPDVRTKDIEDLFQKYGKIVYLDLKNRKGPPFAFLEYEDPRDADDAIYSRDGYSFDGYKLKVELSKGGRSSRTAPCGVGLTRNKGYASKHSNFRVKITGLPSTGSWQDLKDHMRTAGDVCFTEVYKNGTGIVEFNRHEDMKYAVRKLDNTKFRSHEGDTSYIRVCEDSGDSRRSQSRSRSRSRSKGRADRRGRGSPSYSPMRRRDYSRSRSRS